MWAVSQRRLTNVMPRHVVRVLTFILAALVAAFLWTLTNAQHASALDAKWENADVISHEGREYRSIGEATGARPPDAPGLPAGSKMYQAIEPDTQTAHIIYFDKEEQVDQETSAGYISFKYTESTGYGVSTGPTSTISIDKKADLANRDNQTPPNESERTSCIVGGIGYIVCPIIDHAARAMDWMFDVLRRFLEVEPLMSDNDSTMYKAWQIMRNIANVAFVIALLVAIYSYVVNRGVSTYDIKKMLPRLVIASVLVNVSYIICALAVDGSNILGVALQDLFNDIRSQTQGSVDVNLFTWENMATLVLSGGTIVAGAAVGIAAIATAGVGTIFFLVPILITAGLSLLVAVAILAARQALITVLIVVAPIAFVAYVLPNTEKYFDKWRGIFTTMLLVFPIFSMLFGGSQLAAQLMVQNTDQLTVVIFAMFIQVAPLIITPFLIRFSGGLLGKLAGIINNPTKGIADRGKNWAKGRTDDAKARRMQEQNRGWRRTPGLALAQSADSRRRKREGLRKYHEANRDAQFAGTDVGQMLAHRMADAERTQGISDNRNKASISDAVLNDVETRAQAVRLQEAETKANLTKAKTEEFQKAIQSTKGRRLNAEKLAASGVARQAHTIGDMAEQSLAVANATQMAEIEHRLEYAQNITKGPAADALRAAAAGVAADAGGKNLAAARALQEMRSDFGKNSGAMKEMLDHFNVSGEDVKALAKKQDSISIVKDGVRFEFRKDDEYAVDAAIESLFEKKGNYDGMRELVELSGTDEYAAHRSTIASGVAQKMVQKAGFMGGSNIDQVTVGKVKTEADYMDLIRLSIAGGKFKQEFFASNDANALADVLKVIKSGAEGLNRQGSLLDNDKKREYIDNVQRLSMMADKTLMNENVASSLTEKSIRMLEAIRDTPHAPPPGHSGS